MSDDPRDNVFRVREAAGRSGRVDPDYVIEVSNNGGLQGIVVFQGSEHRCATIAAAYTEIGFRQKLS